MELQRYVPTHIPPYPKTTSRQAFIKPYWPCFGLGGIEGDILEAYDKQGKRRGQDKRPRASDLSGVRVPLAILLDYMYVYIYIYIYIFLK